MDDPRSRQIWNKSDQAKLVGLIEDILPSLFKGHDPGFSGLRLGGGWAENSWRHWVVLQVGSVWMQIPLSEEDPLKVSSKEGVAVKVLTKQGRRSRWEDLGNFPHDAETKERGPWWVILHQSLPLLENKITSALKKEESVAEAPQAAMIQVSPDPIIDEKRISELRDKFILED